MAQGGTRILVVEDEPSIGQGLCDVLVFRGHQVTWETNGLAALQLAQADTFDLLLLDVMLPELDGYSICRKLRQANVRAGIILLTAKGAEDDILKGFELGADDYVTKPFSLKQLLARVEALLGRSRRDAREVLSGGSLLVHPDTAQAQGPRGTIELSARELRVLQTLLDEPGRIVSRRHLLREVWEMQNVELMETRTVDMHMVKLRKKLSEIGDDEIQTVRGQGYRFVAGGVP